MRDMYMKSGDGFLVVYSIIDKTTFVEAEDLYGDVLRVRDQEASTIPLLLVGNKCDLADMRKVSYQEGQQKAAQWNVPFYEASAKVDTNIAKVFETVTKQILKMEINGQKKKKAKRGRCSIL